MPDILLSLEETFKTPREYGHKPIQFIHHVYDRGVKGATETWNQRFHKIQMEDVASTVDEAAAITAYLLTWQSTVGCFCHDIHNALKWIALEYTRNAATLKGTFISMASCRNGYEVLMTHVGRWIPSRIMFEDWEGMDRDALHSFYTVLGIDDEWVDKYIDCQI